MIKTHLCFYDAIFSHLSFRKQFLQQVQLHRALDHPCLQAFVNILFVATMESILVHISFFLSPVHLSEDQVGMSFSPLEEVLYVQLKQHGRSPGQIFGVMVVHSFLRNLIIVVVHSFLSNIIIVPFFFYYLSPMPESTDFIVTSLRRL